VQLYRYFVSQSSEFCRHNPLCYFLMSVYCCSCLFRYNLVRKLLDTPSYANVVVGPLRATNVSTR